MAETIEKKNAVSVDQVKGETAGYTLARLEVDPVVRHSLVAHNAAGAALSSELRSGVGDHVDRLRDVCDEVSSGDLSTASRMLTAQAVTLDGLFTQMATRAQANMGQHLGAADTYLRLALKAQAQSRATLEALVKMHQPREQTVRHVHVGPDGQAVFIENYGGGGNGQINGRPPAPGAIGPAMLGYDAGGNGVPIASGEGKAAVPDARRCGRQRRAAGES